MPEDVVMETQEPASTLETDAAPSAPQTRTERLASMRSQIEARQDAPETPAAPSPAPAPAQQTAEALNEEKVGKMLQDAQAKWFEAMRREIGQGSILPKKLQGLADKYAELEKRLSAQPQNALSPGVLASLPPEEQAAYKKLVKEIWEAEFGKEWNDLRQSREDAQKEREFAQIQTRINSIVDRTRETMGEQYKEFEPVAQDLFKQLLADADGGNEEAQKWLDEIFNTQSGPFAFISFAQQKYAQQIAQKNQAAVAQQDKKAKVAATTLSTASKSGSAKPDLLSQKPTPENRKDWLKAAKDRLGTTD